MRAYEANFRNRFGRRSARSERLCRLYTEVPERTEKAGEQSRIRDNCPMIPAKELDCEKEIGSIAPGKLADIIV